MDQAKAVCTCVLEGRLRRVAGAGIKVAGIVLQIGAPKCAICWTTYAGLINAGWFAVQSANPFWLAFATLTSIMSLVAGLQRALKTRRYAGFLGTTLAWALLVAGWLLDLALVRYAGFALLLISYATGLFARQTSR